MSLLPEIKLKKILDYLLDQVRNDYYNNSSNEQKSFLYRVFSSDNNIDNYNFFTQAKAILLRGNDNQRKLETRIFFDRSRAHIPTIHINLPSESPQGDSLGFGIGNTPPIFDDNDQTYSHMLQRSFDTKYNITVTSDNTFEVIVIYTLLKAILISQVDIIEMNGLRNPKISGRDLMVMDQITPPLFMRILVLDFMYEFDVPELKLNPIINHAVFYGYEGSLGVNNILLITGEV